MKILLGLLGTLTITTTPVAVLTQTLVSINPRFDPIDEVEVSDEMKSALSDLKEIKANPAAFDDNYIVKAILQNTLMSAETTNQNFYYSILNEVRETINTETIKERLDSYEFGEEKFTVQIKERLNNISRENQIKMNAKVFNAYKDYQKTSDSLSRAYFDLYDSTITKLAIDILNNQSKISKINIRNAEIQEKLKGIAKENEIIGNIIKLLDVTLGFINTSKNIFDNAIGVVNNNFGSAKWHADNWGLGFIPFYGVGFNITFQNRMNDTISGMDTYIVTFSDQMSEGAIALAAMREELDGLSQKINSVDPTNNDLIGSLMAEADAGPLLTGFVQSGVDAGIIILDGILPGLGKAIEIIMQFLTAAFNAKKLAENFNVNLKEKTLEFIKESDSVRDPIYNGRNSVLNIQSKLRAKLKVNNLETAKLADELNSNKKELDDLNEKTKLLKGKSQEIDAAVTLGISKGLMTNNLFFWYSNKVADIDFLNRHKSFLNKKDNLEDLITTKEQQFEILKKEMQSFMGEV